MSAVSQGSLAVLALMNRFTDVGVAPLKASELWRLLERVDDPAGLLGLDERTAGELTPGTGVDPMRLVRLLDAGVGLAARVEALYERGIAVITALDEMYPHRLRDRLGGAAPPVLYCAGEVSLLGVDGVGVVGSREVGPEAIEATRKVAQLVAGAGLPVVSGGAKGVDAISMAASYEAGGSAIGVLADSLERAIGQADNRRAMLDGRACLCTPYRPDARFTTGSAMGRNKIIYGLARVTLVVASALGEGGTWSGATEALKKRYGRVAVWTGAGRGPGNDALVDAGGTPIEQPELVLELASATSTSAMEEGQMALAFDEMPESE
jgi:predicted Rossmann fold nucleotide-binding protein DprA/Smf involved in DNA uptake